MRLLMLTAGLLGLYGTVCCSSVPPVGVVAAAQEGMPVFSDYSSALRYVLSKMQEGKTPLMLRMSSNSRQTAQKLSQDCAKHSMITKVKSMALGHVVSLELTYVDDTLLLAAHKGYLPESQLTASQRNALHKIQGVVNGIMRQHASQYAQALAMHDYILTTSLYDVNMKTWDHATVTVDLINTHRSVCDGYTRLYHMMLSMAGIENRIVVGSSSDNMSHSWNLVRLDGVWTHVDCTYDDPVPDEAGRTMRHYFGMTDAQIGRNHRWNRAEYPAATSNSVYYPTTHGLRFNTMEEFLRYCPGHAAAGNQNISAYVKEADSARVDSKELLERTQNKMRMNLVKSLQVDDGAPGVLYCQFR